MIERDKAASCSSYADVNHDWRSMMGMFFGTRGCRRQWLLGIDERKNIRNNVDSFG